MTKVGGARRVNRAAFQPPVTVSRREFLRRGGDAWFREAIYVTVQGQGRLLACREAFGRAIGITANQFAVLFGVAYLQGEAGVTITELARHAALAPAHVTTEVGKLLKKDYLAKRRSETDRRSVLVSLSRTGEQAVLDVTPLVTSINDTLFQGIAADELATVATVMTRLISNAEFAAVKLRQHALAQARRAR